MIVIDLMERKVGAVESRLIPMDNLTGEDLDWFKSLSGNMTDEIYSQFGRINRVRNCDSHLATINTVRVVLVKDCVLFWTILQGNLSKRPHLDQLCSWLNETPATHKGELMLVEREVHEKVEGEGPEVLFGESLEEALKTAPCSEETMELPEENNPDPWVDMDDSALQELFDYSSLDLFADPEPEILLTKVAPPRFEVDFEVEEGEPTSFTDEDEINMVIDKFFSNTPMSEKDLTLTEEV